MKAVTSAPTGQQIAATGGMAGGYWFGPWGALAGLALGAVAGAMFGQKVADRRRIAIRELDKFLPRACSQLNRILVERLDEIVAHMRANAIANYRMARSRAAACVHLLPSKARAR